MCAGANHTIYRKSFSGAFCNFDTTTTPAAFRVLDQPFLKCKGTHGYSTTSNILRRTSSSEPFTTHPIAMLLNSNSEVEIKKHVATYKKNYELIEGGLSNLVESGISYRIETTFETDLQRGTNWSSIRQSFDLATMQFERLCVTLMENHGILIRRETFPESMKQLCIAFKPVIDSIIEKIETSSYITIKQKETICAFENLVLYCINGNPNCLSHSFFSATRIRENISNFGFPFSTIDIGNESLEADLSDDYFMGLKLLQQQMNPLNRDMEIVTLTNRIYYLIENLRLDDEYSNQRIVSLLEKIFRRDICTIFKKRLLKSAVDEQAKFRLLELDSEYTFFDELEKEVVFNSVIVI